MGHLLASSTGSSMRYGTVSSMRYMYGVTSLPAVPVEFNPDAFLLPPPPSPRLKISTMMKIQKLLRRTWSRRLVPREVRCWPRPRKI